MLAARRDRVPEPPVRPPHGRRRRPPRPLDSGIDTSNLPLHQPAATRSRVTDFEPVPNDLLEELVPPGRRVGSHCCRSVFGGGLRAHRTADRTAFTGEPPLGVADGRIQITRNEPREPVQDGFSVDTESLCEFVLRDVLRVRDSGDESQCWRFLINRIDCPLEIVGRDAGQVLDQHSHP